MEPPDVSINECLDVPETAVALYLEGVLIPVERLGVSEAVSFGALEDTSAVVEVIIGGIVIDGEQPTGNAVVDRIDYVAAIFIHPTLASILVDPALGCMLRPCEVLVCRYVPACAIQHVR